MPETTKDHLRRCLRALKAHMKACPQCTLGRRCSLGQYGWNQCLVAINDTMDDCWRWHLRNHEPMDVLFDKFDRILQVYQRGEKK